MFDEAFEMEQRKVEAIKQGWHVFKSRDRVIRNGCDYGLQDTYTLFRPSLMPHVFGSKGARNSEEGAWRDLPWPLPPLPNWYRECREKEATPDVR